MNQLYGADVGVLGRFDGFAGLPLESHRFLLKTRRTG